MSMDGIIKVSAHHQKDNLTRSPHFVDLSSSRMESPKTCVFEFQKPFA